jgi:phosphatidylglycerol:prolipoprotein diacylglycerol transferase
MVVLAVLWFFIARKLPDKEVVRVYPEGGLSGLPVEKDPQEREEARKNRRKLRKRLK